MAQNFTTDWYELTYVVDTAFQNAENNDNVLRSNFSGSAAPTSPVVGQQWFDIDTGTMKVYEIDAQWIASLVGGPDFKVWLYTNDEQRGMTIDNSVTDVVLALRGGNYGASGGVVAGRWDIIGLSNASDGIHGHIWKSHSAGWDYTYDAAGNAFILDNNGLVNRIGIPQWITDGNGFCNNVLFYTNRDGDHTHAISHNSAWRPLGAVGTMQYPNLT